MSGLQILIVEDEVLIADSIERQLLRKGYRVTGKAISYDEAVEAYRSERPDLVLLDIRLNDAKSGLDVAAWLRKQPQSVPFIFLTSQVDDASLESAKAAFPAGYLSKPIQRESLLATIEVVLHNHRALKKDNATIRLYNGKQYFQVFVDDILFLRSEHIYVMIALEGEGEVLQRITLKEMMGQLPEQLFVQTHRSYAVNIRKVSSWGQGFVLVKEHKVPVSRSRRKKVLAYLEEHGA